jgi:hypothetical protein
VDHLTIPYRGIPEIPKKRHPHDGRVDGLGRPEGVVVGYDIWGTENGWDDVIIFAGSVGSHDQRVNGVTFFTYGKFDAMWFGPTISRGHTRPSPGSCCGGNAAGPA